MVSRFLYSIMALVSVLGPSHLAHCSPMVPSRLDKINRCLMTLSDGLFTRNAVKEGELPGWSQPTATARGTPIAPRTTVEDATAKFEAIVISTDTAASLTWAAGAGLKWAGATGVGGTMTTGATATMAVTGPIGLAFLAGGVGAVAINYTSENWAEDQLQCISDAEDSLKRWGLLCDITPEESAKQTAQRVAPTAAAYAKEYKMPELAPAYITAAAERNAEEIQQCKAKMKDSLEKGACGEWGLKTDWQRIRCESIRNVMCSNDPSLGLRKERVRKQLIQNFGSVPQINCSTPVLPTPTWSRPYIYSPG